ncbi:MAG: methanethiol S-methyltransferase [Phycisphaerales bacterium]
MERAASTLIGARSGDVMSREMNRSANDLFEGRLHAPLAHRIGVFVYGVVSYAITLVIFVYAFGFIGSIGTPTSLDRLPTEGSPRWPTALAINLAVLFVFAVQHSVMARPWFKAIWTRIIPEPAERSTYVLFSNIAMILLFALWQPMGGVIWNTDSPGARAVLLVIYSLGWGLVLLATFVLNHFDLFGVRQVWLYLRDRPYTHLPFRTPLLYRIVRHPLYVGWLIVFWATPTMTAAHLVFALVTTIYILLAIRWEEKDMATLHGSKYVEYRDKVGKLIPAVK